MKDLQFMILLGIAGGFISGLWTRVIKTNMIFRKFGKWLTIVNNRHLIEYTSDSLWVKFIRCIFCISVWVVLLLELWYVLYYTPYWMIAVIGVFGGLGAGNFVCEVTHTLRNEQ